MERGAIIKKFLTSGLQLDSNALDFFIKNTDKIDVFFEEKNKLKSLPSVISLKVVESILKEEDETRPEKIEFLRKVSEIEGKITVSNFTDYLNKRYDTLKSMFTNRLDLVNPISVNKITPKIKKFSLIGIVKEKNISDKTLLLEDKTGYTTLSLEDVLLDQVVEDEVIGVMCDKGNDDKIMVKNIVFPDVPLRRVINKTKNDVYCFFISDIHMDSKSFNEKTYENFLEWLNKQKHEMYIFILGDISSNKKDADRFFSDVSKHQTIFLKGDKDIDINREFYSNPLFSKIENVSIFTFHGNNLDNYTGLWNSTTELLTNLIKKRHLDPIFNSNKKIYKEDPYLLDTIPDIIAVGHLHQPGTTNYKGITIIANGSFMTQPIYWLINLRTRETFKIDFS
jgi:DNA polymerase II small subunit/DNA polymerase delta subunit B